jgi:protein involved in polysaccharide export with SLBB domain
MAGISSLSARLAGALVFVVSIATASSAQDGGAAARAAETYLRPGDIIVLHFPRERLLNDSIFVDERGQAAFPKLGVLNVSKVTIGALLDTLRARYSEFFRIPEFQIATLRRVTVNGEVRMPNVYLVDAASTVRDAIARAGGILETGNKSSVAIVRDGQRIPVKAWDDTGPGADLQSGDLITVGRKSWIVLNAFSAISTAVLVTSFVISVLKR